MFQVKSVGVTGASGALVPKRVVVVKDTEHVTVHVPLERGTNTARGTARSPKTATVTPAQ